MTNFKKINKYKSIILMILAGAVLLVMGCELFSAEYWINRPDTGEGVVGTEPSVDGDVSEPNSSTDDAQQFGARCIDAPGDAPCPLEACVVAADQFSARYVITSELYGKANPNNFSCCAEFQFTNNSKVELMTFEHWISEGDNGWSSYYFSPNGKNDQPVTCSNYYAQKDGETTYWRGITEIIVIYANPHCDWIKQDEPKLKNYIVPITGLCAP